MDSQYKEALILHELKLNGKMTANELIEQIFSKDLRYRGIRFILDRGWKFYVHLNKHFSVLEKNKKIESVIKKPGPTGRVEKVWKLTSSGKKIEKKIFSNKSGSIKDKVKASLRKEKDKK